MTARRLAVYIALSVVGTIAAMTPSAVIVYSIKHASDESAHAARVVERMQRSAAAESDAVRIELTRLRVQMESLRRDMENER